MSDIQQQIEDFKAITSVNDNVARSYLEMSQNNLELALQNYFDFMKPNQNKSSSSSSKPVGGMTSFRDLQGEDAPDDEDEQRYYAGSGQQVIGDGKKSSKLPQNDEDAQSLTDKIFKKAQEQGAVPTEEPTQQKQSYFSGSGQRLGSTPSTSQVISSSSSSGQQSTSAPKQAEPVKNVTITFYKQGFVVDDGELRRYDEPKNKAFLSAMDDGYVPAEVSGMAKEVQVSLVNKKDEDYVKPKETFKAFGTEGKSLSSGSSSSASSASALSTAPAKSYSCDESKPNTLLQIRLFDGTTLKTKFNLTDNVSSIYGFVKNAKPVNKPFVLSHGHPKQNLENGNLTLEEAGLKRAQVVQTLL
ncbi:UBX domain-containing protein [Acrasis kona]|uniref:UBX domain-containing protein n=1 Tax=Acrasis kona TaxID=1008807 RepID=A0AAW2ZJ49_9EUKA